MGRQLLQQRYLGCPVRQTGQPRAKARKVPLHAIELAKASGQDYSLTQELLDQL